MAQKTKKKDTTKLIAKLDKRVAKLQRERARVEELTREVAQLRSLIERDAESAASAAARALDTEPANRTDRTGPSRGRSASGTRRAARSRTAPATSGSTPSSRGSRGTSRRTSATGSSRSSSRRRTTAAAPANPIEIVTHALTS